MRERLPRWILLAASLLFLKTSAHECKWLGLALENSTGAKITFSVDKASIVCVTNCADLTTTTSTAILQSNVDSCKPAPSEKAIIEPYGRTMVYVQAFCGLTCLDVDSAFTGTFTSPGIGTIGTLAATQKVHKEWTVTTKQESKSTYSLSDPKADCSGKPKEVTACYSIKIGASK